MRISFVLTADVRAFTRTGAHMGKSHNDPDTFTTTLVCANQIRWWPVAGGVGVVVLLVLCYNRSARRNALTHLHARKRVRISV